MKTETFDKKQMNMMIPGQSDTRNELHKRAMSKNTSDDGGSCELMSGGHDTVTQCAVRD